MIAAARIRLTEASGVYQRPFVGADRISLAWWEPGDPEPVIIADASGRPCTLVIVWPTDHEGMIDVVGLRAHRYEVLPWHLDQDALRALKEIHDAWPLDRHDLRVTRDSIEPTLRTFREWPYLRADSLIARASAALLGAR